MKHFSILYLFIFSFLLCGISVYSSAQRKITKKPQKYDRNGIASFYHDRFEGRLTATGERFHQRELTAASNTLPLNSYVKVTNLKNGYWVVVRINDRMNKHNRRLIDLSKAAAKTIHFTSGLLKVNVQYIPAKKFYPFTGLSLKKMIGIASH